MHGRHFGPAVLVLQVMVWIRRERFSACLLFFFLVIIVVFMIFVIVVVLFIILFLWFLSNLRQIFCVW